MVESDAELSRRAARLLMIGGGLFALFLIAAWFVMDSNPDPLYQPRWERGAIRYQGAPLQQELNADALQPGKGLVEPPPPVHPLPRPQAPAPTTAPS